MEQITLIFLIGAFILFLAQVVIKKELVLNHFGFLTDVTLIALTLADSELKMVESAFSVMLITGFALSLFSLTRIFKKS